MSDNFTYTLLIRFLKPSSGLPAAWRASSANSSFIRSRTSPSELPSPLSFGCLRKYAGDYFATSCLQTKRVSHLLSRDATFCFVASRLLVADVSVCVMFLMLFNFLPNGAFERLLVNFARQSKPITGAIRGCRSTILIYCT